MPVELLDTVRRIARLHVDQIELLTMNEPCSPGLDALGWYHEKHDEARNIGLGPDHDWSSHGADAFGLMCVAYEEPQKRPLVFPKPDMRWVV
jgi:hypothetical protein